MIRSIFIGRRYGQGAWLALLWADLALATAAAPSEEWISMTQWDAGAQLNVKVTTPLSPGHELWVGTQGEIPGRHAGFRSTIEVGESATIWNFDLFWGGTCMDAQPCNYERHFRIAVHHNGKVRCRTEFSTADLVSPHRFEFEMIDTGEGCRLQKAALAAAQ